MRNYLVGVVPLRIEKCYLLPLISVDIFFKEVLDALTFSRSPWIGRWCSRTYDCHLRFPYRRGGASQIWGLFPSSGCLHWWYPDSCFHEHPVRSAGKGRAVAGT